MVKDRHHVSVSTERFRSKDRDAPRSRGRDEAREESSAQSPALVVVTDHERHLRLTRPGISLVASHAHQFITVFDDEREAVVVVDVGEVFDLDGGEFGVEGEVAGVDGFGREVPVEPQ